MKEKPIIFSGAEIRDILNGTKTQFRVIVKEKTLIHLRQDGCHVIFTAIQELENGKIDIEAYSNISESGLYGWERWSDLFKNQICRIWEEGVRGLVSVNWLQAKERILDCVLISREHQDYEIGTQTGLHGVSRDADFRVDAGKAFGRESRKQLSGEFEVGHAVGKLARQEGARSGNRGGKAPDEQINRQGEGLHKMGFRKGYCVTTAHCKDVGDVTIRYTEDLQKQAGLNLWVREKFAHGWHYAQPNYLYAATDSVGNSPDFDGWKPSIHMPREASRITIEVTAVRCERLQDISEADAMKEGLEDHGYSNLNYLTKQVENIHPKESFQTLWQSIHGPDSWNANPWVWVYEFRRVKP